MNNITPENSTIWKNKNFLLLWLATTLSSITFFIITFSLPILIYNFTSSSFAISFLKVVEILPTLLFGLIIGVLVDRYNKKKILNIAVSFQIIIVLIIGIIINTAFNLWLIYSLSLMLFTCGFLFSKAYYAILPTIVSKENLVAANSSLSMISSIIMIIGPSFASFITISLSKNYSFIVTIFGLTILLIVINVSDIYTDKNIKKTVDKKNLLDEMKLGWDHIKENTGLWTMTKMILILNIATGLSGGVIVYYSLNSLNVTNTNLGIIMASTGIGALLASIFSNKIKKSLARGKLILTLTIFTSLGQFILGFTSYWYILSFGLIIIGFCLVLINIHFISLRQESTPINLQGRVAGTISTIVKISVPLTYLIGGILAEFLSPKYIFLFSSFILIILFLYGKKRDIHLLV